MFGNPRQGVLVQLWLPFPSMTNPWPIVLLDSIPGYQHRFLMCYRLSENKTCSPSISLNNVCSVTVTFFTTNRVFVLWSSPNCLQPIRPQFPYLESHQGWDLPDPNPPIGDSSPEYIDDSCPPYHDGYQEFLPKLCNDRLEISLSRLHSPPGQVCLLLFGCDFSNNPQRIRCDPCRMWSTAVFTTAVVLMWDLFTIVTP